MKHSAGKCTCSQTAIIASQKRLKVLKMNCLWTPTHAADSMRAVILEGFGVTGVRVCVCLCVCKRKRKRGRDMKGATSVFEDVSGCQMELTREPGQQKARDVRETLETKAHTRWLLPFDEIAQLQWTSLSVCHVVIIVVWDFPPASAAFIIFNQSNALTNPIECDESASFIFQVLCPLSKIFTLLLYQTNTEKYTICKSFREPCPRYAK